MLLACAIEDDTHILGLVLGVQSVDIRQLLTLQHTLSNNIDAQVGNTAGDQRIGNNQCRNAVDDDVVVVLTALLEEVVQTLRHQQLGRVWRLQTCVDKVEILVHTAIRDDIVHLNIVRTQKEKCRTKYIDRTVSIVENISGISSQMENLDVVLVKLELQQK